MALSPELRKLVSGAVNKYKGGNGNVSKPKEGRNVYRLVFKLWGADQRFYRDLGVHWIKAGENDKPIAVVGDCDTVYQTPSLISAAIDQAIASAPDEENKKLYEGWRSRRTVLINVVNRTEKDEEQVLELTTTTFGKVLDLIMLYDAEGQDILDNKIGCDIVITRSGKGLGTTYDVQIAPLAPGKLFKALDDDQVARAVNLDEFIAQNYFRGEEQKALNAIAQISGIRVPQIGAITAATPTPALTSQHAAVTDAKAPVAPVAAGPSAEDLALDARKAAILKKRAEMQAELEAMEAEDAVVVATTVAPAAAAVTPATSMSDLPESEQEAILAELDSLADL